MLKFVYLLFFRSFKKNLVINTMNLLGLAAGMAACMMIIIYLVHEHSYDDAHLKAERIARVNTDLAVGDGQAMHLPTASFPVSAGLASEIAGIESFVRFRLSGSERPVYVGEQVFFEEHIAWVDSTVFSIFSYNLIRGNPNTALAAPLSIVISRSTADKFFGDVNPLGERISFDRKKEYTITGVMEDIPEPSHLPSFPMLMSLTSLQPGGADYWVGRSNYASYVLLVEGQTVADLQPLVDKVFEERTSELLESLGARSNVTLQPVKDIHFADNFDFAFDFTPPVTRAKLAIFSIIAAFILMISTVSFINLATARSSERARHVGISKAVGASRNMLVAQYLGEFICVALLALGVALIVVDFILPVFGTFVGRELSADYLAEPLLLLSFFSLALMVGGLAGLYPAFFLSSFRPVDTIRSARIALVRSRMRPVLIVFQFTISIILVICTLTVVNQLEFMNDRDPGFDREHLLVLSVAPDMSRQDCEMLRQEALKHPGILKGTMSSYLPTMGYMEYTYEVPEPEDCDMLMARQLMVDEYFIDAMGLEIVDGRGFDLVSADTDARSESEDGGISRIGESGGLIINVTAAKKLGYDEPVGRFLDANPASGGDQYSPVEIIGVVKDINFESLHHEVQPMILARGEGRPARISLRLAPGDVAASIGHIEELWKKSFPSSPFRYSFLDENFERIYISEIRISRLFTFYTALAVIISSIGLLALIAYSAERRTREVGVRKVLGASVGNLFYLLSSGYVRLVLIATLIAWPVAWYAMARWMDNFAFKAPFAWQFYPLAGGLALFLSILTSVVYTVRVCRLNPADTLRQE